MQVPRCRSFCGRDGRCGVASLSLSACRKMYDEIGGGEQSACEFGVRIDGLSAAKSRGEERRGEKRHSTIQEILKCCCCVVTAMPRRRLFGFGGCNRIACFERRRTGIVSMPVSVLYIRRSKGFTPRTSLSHRLCGLRYG
jgi:hypothetical protein